MQETAKNLPLAQENPNGTTDYLVDSANFIDF